jgi:hypothetical protein
MKGSWGLELNISNLLRSKEKNLLIAFIYLFLNIELIVFLAINRIKFPLLPAHHDDINIYIKLGNETVDLLRPIPKIIVNFIEHDQAWVIFNIINLNLVILIVLILRQIIFQLKPADRSQKIIIDIVILITFYLFLNIPEVVEIWGYRGSFSINLSLLFALIFLKSNLNYAINSEKRGKRVYIILYLASLLSFLTREDAIFAILVTLFLTALYQKRINATFDKKYIATFSSIFISSVSYFYLLQKSSSPFTSMKGEYEISINVLDMIVNAITYPSTKYWLLLLIISFMITGWFIINNHRFSEIYISSYLLVFTSIYLVPYLLLSNHRFGFYTVLFNLLSVFTLINASRSNNKARNLITTISMAGIAIFTFNNFGEHKNLRESKIHYYKNIENQNYTIIKSLLEYRSNITNYECAVIYDPPFLSPWIFDTGKYANRIIGKEINWHIYVDDDTYLQLSSFEVFPYLSVINESHRISIERYESTENNYADCIKFKYQNFKIQLI